MEEEKTSFTSSTSLLIPFFFSRLKFALLTDYIFLSSLAKIIVKCCKSEGLTFHDK